MKHAVLAFVIFLAGAMFAQNVPPSNVPPYRRVPDIAERTDLSGKWMVKWLDGGLPNKIVLMDNGGGLDGFFVADSGERCLARGDYSRVEGIHIQVRCSRWIVELLGQLQSDNGTILGTYLAYGTTRGHFRMERMYCF